MGGVAKERQGEKREVEEMVGVKKVLGGGEECGECEGEGGKCGGEKERERGRERGDRGERERGRGRGGEEKTGGKEVGE